MRALIVCGGDFSPRLLPKKKKDDLLIAADLGFALLKSASLVPDAVIGDFDSLGYVPDNAIVLPVRKDDTDLMAAVRYGLERGMTECLIFGALGGKRFSHSLAAVQTLGFLAEKNVYAEAVDERCTVSALSCGSRSFPGSARGLISVFALSGEVRVTLKGLSYPLESHVLSPGFPLGVSNSFTGEPSSVTASDGTVIIVLEQ